MVNTKYPDLNKRLQVKDFKPLCLTPPVSLSKAYVIVHETKLLRKNKNYGRLLKRYSLSRLRLVKISVLTNYHLPTIYAKLMQLLTFCPISVAVLVQASIARHCESKKLKSETTLGCAVQFPVTVR